MKFITVRIDEKMKRIEKRKKAREKRAAANRLRRRPRRPPLFRCSRLNMHRVPFRVRLLRLLRHLLCMWNRRLNRRRPSN